MAIHAHLHRYAHTSTPTHMNTKTNADEDLQEHEHKDEHASVREVKQNEKQGWYNEEIIIKLSLSIRQRTLVYKSYRRLKKEREGLDYEL